MKKVIHSKPIISCVLVFFVCCIARIIEYFLIRTDETILAENFIHKIFGIVFRYPLMFFQICPTLFGIAMIEHIEYGVDLALDNLKIVIFDVPR